MLIKVQLIKAEDLIKLEFITALEPTALGSRKTVAFIHVAITKCPLNFFILFLLRICRAQCL